MAMDLRKIKSLVELMNENALSEVEVEEEGMKVRLRKGGQGSGGVVTAAPSTLPVSAALPAVYPTASAATPPVAAPAGRTINSPMVGTFYRAAGPQAKSFVEAGAPVGKDTVVCIIEAMKVMNEIKAECEGVVEDILVQNGQAVEFGQPLFRLRV